MPPEWPTRRERAVPAARWRRIEEVFLGALAVDEREREPFVSTACSGDPALQAEVLALLASSQDAERYVGEIVADGLSMFADGDAPLLERRLGPYRLVALIGEGGMGAVYVAERDDAEFRRQVAVKVLRAGLASREVTARFRDERQILADLDHPGIVRLIDGGTSDGMPYLVMEKVEGMPITRHADDRALSVRDRIALVRATCDALAYAHAQHVVHRDLKPSNLLVTTDGHPKLVDFGIAKLLDAREREARTKTGVMPLTPEYASPEQVTGAPITPATDIYSLGAVMYELLTGRPPQQAQGGTLALIRAICEDEPPLPSAVAPPDREIPRTLDLVVMKALRKKPEERYASVAELEQDLARVLEGRAVSAGPPSWLHGAKRAVAKSRLARVAVLGLVVTAVAGTAWLVSRPAAPVAPIDMRRLTSQLGVLSAARFGPDERTLIYSAAWSGAPTAVYTMQLGEPARELLPDAKLLAVAANGDLAVLVRAKVAGMGATPLVTGTLVGTDARGHAPVELAEDVLSADWAPTGELAITRWIPGTSTNGTDARGLVEWPIGTTIYETGDRQLDSLRISRDGERLAFLEGNAVKQIVVIDRSRRVTKLGTPHDVDGVAWRGGELWVSDTTDQGERCVHAFGLDDTRRLVQCGTGMLTLQDVDRAGRVLVTSTHTDARILLKAPGGADEREVQWHTTDRLYDVSADGRRMVFGAGGLGGPLYLRELDREGAAPVRIGTGIGAAISPDGAWVATSREGQRHFLTPTSGGREVERITDVEVKLQSELLGGWAPDGKRLYTACILHDETPATCAFGLDGRGTIVIRGKRPGASMNMRSISPDGAWILGTDGRRSLELIATDGSTAQPLPDTRATRSLGHDGFDTAVGWGADSRSLFVVTGREAARLTIEQLDVTTGQSQPWKTTGPAERSGHIEFTGVVVFGGGDGYAYSYARTLSDLYLLTGLR